MSLHVECPCPLDVPARQMSLLAGCSCTPDVPARRMSLPALCSCLTDVPARRMFFNTIFVSSHMYPVNPEETQVIVGSMNMGYISDTARNRTHNLFRPKREPIPLGHSDGRMLLHVECPCPPDVPVRRMCLLAGCAYSPDVFAPRLPLVELEFQLSL